MILVPFWLVGAWQEKGWNPAVNLVHNDTGNSPEDKRTPQLCGFPSLMIVAQRILWGREPVSGFLILGYLRLHRASAEPWGYLGTRSLEPPGGLHLVKYFKKKKYHTSSPSSMALFMRFLGIVHNGYHFFDAMQI